MGLLFLTCFIYYKKRVCQSSISRDLFPFVPGHCLAVFVWRQLFRFNFVLKVFECCLCINICDSDLMFLFSILWILFYSVVKEKAYLKLADVQNSTEKMSVCHAARWVLSARIHNDLSLLQLICSVLNTYDVEPYLKFCQKLYILSVDIWMQVWRQFICYYHIIPFQNFLFQLFLFSIRLILINFYVNSVQTVILLTAKDIKIHGYFN